MLSRLFSDGVSDGRRRDSSQLPKDAKLHLGLSDEKLFPGGGRGPALFPKERGEASNGGPVWAPASAGEQVSGRKFPNAIALISCASALDAIRAHC
jgi:hypothetical protein